jgi:hypothetical protein
MQDAMLIKQLKAAGCTVQQVQIAQRFLNAQHEDAAAAGKLDAWVHLLAPLKQQIRAMQSGRGTWKDDIHRAPVYTLYLTSLLAARSRITTAQQLNFTGQSIKDVAAALGVMHDAHLWAAWVPAQERQQVTLAFEELYNVTLPDAGFETGGQRVIPYSTASERRTSDARWARMWSRLCLLVHANEHDPQMDLPCRYIRLALERIKHRSVSDISPINWTHLLTQDARQDLLGWLEDHPELADNMRPPVQSAIVVRTERREARKAKMRAYSAKRRAEKAQSRGTPPDAP